MHSIKFENKATLAGEDLSTHIPKCQWSSDQEKLLKESSKKNPHDTIYDYIDTLRVKYREDLDGIYDCAVELLSIEVRSLGYREGFKKTLLEICSNEGPRHGEPYIISIFGGVLWTIFSNFCVYGYLQEFEQVYHCSYFLI